MTLMGRIAAAVSGAIVAGSVLYLRPTIGSRCFSYHPQPGEPLPPGTRLLSPNGPLCPISPSPGPLRWWLASIALALGLLIFFLAKPRHERAAEPAG